jgi:DNA-binding MarR family transcriptional regulator
MNINELEKDIQKHKEKSPETYNEIINVTIPFYIFYNKLMQGVTSLQEELNTITNSELDVLASLIMSGSDAYILSPTKLYERLLFTSGAITKLLKKLEEKKYIIRIDNQFDKRSKLVQITPLGKKVCQETLKEVILYEEQCFSVLDEKEKEQFKNTLIKMIKNL